MSKYAYLTDEEVRQLTKEGKAMEANGTFYPGETEKYLDWHNEQNRPMTFSQWAAGQPI